MSGEILALLAAFSYGLAGVAISKGKACARGDNGIFLSVVLTAALSYMLWILWGKTPATALVWRENLSAIASFVLAGLASTVLGRITMYRATEITGAVAASLLRRLTPVFALPLGLVVLAQTPDIKTLVGGCLILVGVIQFLCARGCGEGIEHKAGLVLGAASALFYATAYTLRGLGLERLADPALGTLIGAVAGLAWFTLRPMVCLQKRQLFWRLFCDRGKWHLLGALMLSIGQVLQFFALQTASVVAVAVLGSLEVLFAAVLGTVLIGPQVHERTRFLVSLAFAIGGTALLFQ